MNEEHVKYVLKLIIDLIKVDKKYIATKLHG